MHAVRYIMMKFVQVISKFIWPSLMLECYVFFSLCDGYYLTFVFGLNVGVCYLSHVFSNLHIFRSGVS